LRYFCRRASKTGLWIFGEFLGEGPDKPYLFRARTYSTTKPDGAEVNEYKQEALAIPEEEFRFAAENVWTPSSKVIRAHERYVRGEKEWPWR